MTGRVISVHATEAEARERAAKLTLRLPTKLFDVVYQKPELLKGSSYVMPWTVIEINV